MKNENFLLKSFFVLDQFSSINRFAKNRSVKVENDLEHTGWVALWSYFVAIDIQNTFNIEIDFGTLLSGALVHDLDETLMGDVPRPLKYFNSKIRNAIQEIEEVSIKELDKYLINKEKDNPLDKISSDWKNAKVKYNYPTIEQYIVTIADFMSVIYKVWQEVIVLNNYSFSSVAQEVKSGLFGLLYKNKEYGKYINSYTNLTPIELLNYFEEHLNSGLELIDECINITKPINHLISPLIKLEND